MIGKDKKMIELLMERFPKTIQLFGLTPLEARLYTYLYLSQEAKTLDEMSEAIGSSKTAVSTNMRSLVNINLVKRVWKKGVRKDLYGANKQLYKGFMSFYVTKWMTEITENKTSLEEIRDDLMGNNHKSEGTDQARSLESELNNMIEFHSKLEAAFQLLKTE